jgi:hypothetical protein
MAAGRLLSARIGGSVLSGVARACHDVSGGKPSCDGSPGVLTLFFVGDRAQRLRALGEHGRRTL